MALSETDIPNKLLPSTLVKDILDDTFDTLNGQQASNLIWERKSLQQIGVSYEHNLELSAEGVKKQRQLFEEQVDKLH